MHMENEIQAGYTLAFEHNCKKQVIEMDFNLYSDLQVKLFSL